METVKDEFFVNLSNEQARWYAIIKNQGAEDTIPMTCDNNPEELLQLASAYARIANEPGVHNHYMELAEEAYQRVLDSKGHETDIIALRGLAYIFYREYNYYSYWNKKNSGKMLFSKEECENKAMALFDRIMMIGGNTSDYYRYAYLLYNSSSSFSPGIEFTSILSKKDKAYKLYKQAVFSYDDLDDKAKKMLYRTYIKACYGLSRCGLELISSRSRLLDEIVMLFNFEAPFYGDEDINKIRFTEILDCLTIVREGEGLPVEIKDIKKIACEKHTIEQAWNLYYTLGKMYDLAFQYKLLEDQEEAYMMAERYYTYACEIDFIRRQENLPVARFTYMYTALFNLYLRGRKEKTFCLAWKKYNKIIAFANFDKMIFQARWLIVKEKFNEAQQLLDDCPKERGETFFSIRKVELLKDLIHVVTQGCTQEVRDKYKPYQLKQLEKLGNLSGSGN